MTSPDRWPTGGYYDRQATAQTTVAPPGEVAHRSAQMVTYIIVVITCMAVLITLGYGWYVYYQFIHAVHQLGN